MSIGLPKLQAPAPLPPPPAPLPPAPAPPTLASQQVLNVGAQGAAAAAGGSTFNNTLLTSGIGAPTPPTAQKTLLGQ